ncbi:hypothetical protein [Pseudomonas sp. S3_E11]
MISLKPGCTTINFKNMEKTKDNFTLLLYGTIEKGLIDQEIERNQMMIDGKYEPVEHYHKELEYLQRLKLDDNYKAGNLPRGFEKIILQVMESYTFWHSISDVDSQSFLTGDTYIHNLINVSITFMISCELAKLFNYKPGDFSLANVWEHEVDNLKKAKITSDAEIDYISAQFSREETSRDPGIKRFLDFRNKTIAHNASDIGVKWSDFVNSIKFINRAWGIIDELYSPNCFPRPIQLTDQLYAPLLSIFTALQVNQMKEARLKLMEDLFEAASTNLITGVKDGIRPFGDLKVTIQIS